MSHAIASSPVPVSARLRATVGLLVVLAATVALVPLKRWLLEATPVWTGLRVFDVEILYQALTLVLTGVIIFGLRALGAPGRFLRRGDLSTPAEELRVLGVRRGEPWKNIIRNFAIIATTVTLVVVFLQVARDAGNLAPHLPWAFLLSLPFAATNAAVEEGLLRVALLEATVDVLGVTRASLLSGAIFGVVHYFGVPGGLPGVAMAGFLGFVLARSVLETRGAFGAWLLHFLQDVVIFTLLFATAMTGD